MSAAITAAWFEFCLCHEAAETATIAIGVTTRILTAVLSFAGRLLGRFLLWPFAVIGRVVQEPDNTRLFEAVNATIAITSGLFLQISSPPHSTLHAVLERMFPHQVWMCLFLVVGEAQGVAMIYHSYLARAYCSAMSMLLWLVVAEAISFRYRGVAGYHAFLLPLMIGCIITTWVLLERHGTTTQYKD